MRKTKFIAVWALAPLLVVPVGRAQQSDQPLTNQDVIAMVKNALSETVILSAISTNDTNFDVSANGLIALKKAGVTSNVMQAMLKAVNTKKTGTASPTAAQTCAPPPQASPVTTGGIPSGAEGYVNTGSGVATAGAPTGAATPVAAVPTWQPSVSLLQAGQKISLAAEPTQIVQTRSNANSLSALATDQATNQAIQLGSQAAQQAVINTGSVIGSSAVTSSTNVFTGILHRTKQSKVTYVWALAGVSSASTAGSTSPAFQVTYAGIPGVNADAFEPVVVKLAPTPSNFRLVGATQAATNAEQSTQQDWPIYSSFTEDRVAVKVQKLGSGHAQVTLATSLSPGEYAVALRPIDRSHKFSGEDIGRNQGEGLLFNYVWSFAVK